ncbi:MAG TPA: prepilin-type N-terminal cleavage/methylation domain-containing protein [Alphaproteobacteria bacterium]
MRKVQSGFTLLELLLTIGLIAMLLTGVYQMFDNWLQRAVNRQAAADTLRLQQAAADYTFTNFDTLRAAAVSGGTVGVFNEIDIADMIAGNYLPTGYAALNVFRQPMRVFARVRQTPRLKSDGTNAVDGSGNPILISVIDVLTISDNPAGLTTYIPNNRLLDAALAGGPQMGVYSDMTLRAANFAGWIASAQGSWYFDPGDLAAAGYVANPDPALGGYLAAFDIVNGENMDVNDNYLYRVTIDARPELNRMNADLYMNSNQIEDVSSMVADKVVITGNAAFRGVGTGGATATSQAMTVDQALRVDNTGGLTSRFNMVSDNCSFTDGNANGLRDLSAAAGCSVQGGELQVISGNSDATMGIGNFRSIGSVITDSTIVAAAGNTFSQGVSTFQDVDGTDLAASSRVIGGTNVPATVIAPTTNITQGTLTTQEMQASTVNIFDVGPVDNRGVAVGTLVNGPLVAAAVRPQGANTFTTDSMELGNAATLNGNLVVQNINVNTALQVGRIDTNPAGGAHAPETFTDTVLNRQVRCTYKAANGKTYCEPTGDTRYEWPAASGVYYWMRCTIGADGYTCDHYKTSIIPANYLGQCVYDRDDSGSSVKATHSEVCTPS